LTRLFRVTWSVYSMRAPFRAVCSRDHSMSLSHGLTPTRKSIQR
jgi:hypothetical protein